MKQCKVSKQLWRGFKSGLGVLALLAVLGLAACSGDEGNSASAESKANATSAQPDVSANATQPEVQSPAAENEEPGLAVGAKDDFGKFAIEVSAAPEVEGFKRVAVKHDGKLLLRDEDPYRVVTPGAELRDFPLPGCESMTLELFTGGANCCFGYYILTACPDEDVAAFSVPADGGLGEATTVSGEVKGFAMSDPAFMYYSLQGQGQGQGQENGAAALSLNRVESPRPTRYVVFADNAWRADKLGEFPTAYQALAAEAKAAGQDGKTAGQAIILAYYAHMSGADAAEVKAVLRAELPTEFANLSDMIFDDIVKAAAEFDPLEQLATAAKIDFGKFTIEVDADPELYSNFKLVAVKHDGKLLRQDEDAYLLVTPGDELRDFPLPGCQSMALNLYSGGASCCFGHYLLTTCPDGDAAVFREPVDGGPTKATTMAGEAKGFVVYDPDLELYTAGSSEPGFGFCHATSPRPTRHVVFADNAWRVDKVGEFPAAYKALAAEEAKSAEPDDYTQEIASRALILAYYAHMSGADAAGVKAVLRAELPTEFKDSSDTIFDGIVEAAAKFDPLEQLPLP